MASFTRPASGETTTRSSSRRSAKYWVSMNSAVMWSTGLEKKPWIWPAWRSIVSTRSAPPDSSARATRRAEIGSRGDGLLVLARVAEPRRHRDHAVGGGADRRVDHQQQLHQRVVGRHAEPRVAAGRLDDEDVGAADRLLVAAVDLAVGERLERHAAEVDPQLAADPGRQLGVRAAREQHQPLAVGELERGGREGVGIQRAHRSAECTRGCRRRVGRHRSLRGARSA